MTPGESLIRSEIRRDGPISFARFMELALYSPGLGYYETHAKTIGRKGDYFTSVSVGRVFGQLLGSQLARWIQKSAASASEPFWIIEAGAHDGQLAHDILSWLRPDFPDRGTRVRYGLMEPSAARRNWQARKLESFLGSVTWFARWEEVPLVHGVILSNELLDAFPFHRFAWDQPNQAWMELLVTEGESGLTWTSRPADEASVRRLSDDAGFPLSPELQRVLPHGYVLEDSPAARDWWRAAGARLACGRLMAIDYGGTAGDLLLPERPGGTARAYAHHRVSGDLLLRPGEQDLTAHVNFSAIQRTGERSGLVTDFLSRQGAFLSGLAAEAIESGVDFAWTRAQRNQFQTLVHPEHLGHSFRVLVQRRIGNSSMSASAKSFMPNASG